MAIIIKSVQFLEDCKILHPKISSIETWKNIYEKVLEEGAKLKDPAVISWLHASADCSESNLN